MTKETYREIENYMILCAKDSAHDREHVYRVLYNALDIAASEENVDQDVLIAACLLHDVGRPEQFADPSLCHAQVGSQKAYRFLMRLGYEEAFCAKVRDCILTHRFRKNRPPESLEGKILFDADKLDVTGAIGIARTLMYKGDRAEPLYHKDEDGRISDGSGEEAPSFFREYCFKLEKLYDRFYTWRGRELALQRRGIAQSFYEALCREVNHGYEEGRQRLKKMHGEDNI